MCIRSCSPPLKKLWYLVLFVIVTEPSAGICFAIFSITILQPGLVIIGIWSLGSGSLCQLKVERGSFSRILILPSLNFFFKVLMTSSKYVFLKSGVISVYFFSSTGLSLSASFPVSSGSVQYVPLILWPLMDSSSPGIWFKGIAPKLFKFKLSNFFSLKLFLTQF